MLAEGDTSCVVGSSIGTRVAAPPTEASEKAAAAPNIVITIRVNCISSRHSRNLLRGTEPQTATSQREPQR
jgi:hypothetical protein